ncbi:hypothetical protein NEHOM01_1202 [Nematocida homosporus]|uniref:uncharacterized protein n=1 Tax=Nematocida homosporus TaxID=1912981 RepID=UPI00221F17FC|nr:uncharacterized protein NEHOM01_1202 [Nematocida homosporus]KAI5185979.1 hypothetical protein NEHOM01_1202 [Nematocida homosporus]
MFTQWMVTARPNQAGRFKEIKCWIGGLCVLFGLLNFVICAAEAVDPIESLPSSDEIMETLKTLGFEFSPSTTACKVRRHIPTKQQKRSSNPNALRNVPKYVVEALGSSIEFSLPHYSTEEEAMQALESLREIAFIEAGSAVVNYTSDNISCPSANIQILSRVVNMLDCEKPTSYRISKEALQLIGSVDSNARLTEAQNTIQHANAESTCEVVFSTSNYGGLMNVLDSGIILLRPITKVILKVDSYQYLSYLMQLPLTKNYTIVFSDLPKVLTLDLTVLQNLPPKCRMIAFTDNGLKLTLTGLEKPISKHPKLTLHMPWYLLDYLANNNPSKVRVYAISGIEIVSQTYQKTIESLQKREPVESRIFAKKIYLKATADLPRLSLDFYKRCYTRQLYKRVGISVDKVKISGSFKQTKRRFICI